MMFAEMLLLRANSGNKLSRSNKSWDIHMMTYYAAITKKGIKLCCYGQSSKIKEENSQVTKECVVCDHFGINV